MRMRNQVEKIIEFITNAGIWTINADDGYPTTQSRIHYALVVYLLLLLLVVMFSTLLQIFVKTYR